MAPPEIHSSFSVTSGGLCFGDLTEIYKGASTTIQMFPNIRPKPSGTVKSHEIEYNVAAENGIWNVYQLIDREQDDVSGWFVCHSTIVDDPGQEMDKILRVSGSPYETESGSTMNDDKTAAEGIFVINRYDWILSSGNETTIDTSDDVGNNSPSQENFSEPNMCESAGIIDYGQAISQVHAWRAQRPRPANDAVVADNGIWMIIPDGEYRFGRFGFNDTRTAARSFLFFTTNTYFTQTSFRGEGQETFRKEETDQEAFDRRLREGFDFSGVEELNERCDPRPEEESAGILRLHPVRPPEEAWLGPYNRREYLFLPEDLQSLHHQPPILHNPPSLGFMQIHGLGQGVGVVEQWEEQIYDLINEMALSYLERSVLGALRAQFSLPAELELSSATAAESFAAALFPHHPDRRRRGTNDFMLYEYFLHASPIDGFEVAVVMERIVAFFNSRLGADENKVGEREKEMMERLANVMTLLVIFLLDFSVLCAQDCHRSAIVPSDVRVTVSAVDVGMFKKFQYSKVFWRG
ncbi:hypothetical protein N7532_000305 [Penicillium argentinense]|uniref:Uncharacterized protein n=1 Tax=Penicillium argentinense TaxID=1131581 RepID=A0A9W9KN51_9EURO|nr:uncharacterized protein N7532_000305 [Penicillium argentinense]KAJ5112260.1 hypothetical protein N7532_000305 [Penicillium argentinense]